ncbi:unnamed protein product [Miscanthus lutarioriparius]|uniref:Serpin domain-containing protein n=1 Tax=Miscanthus lutarioriparius TaxID=422564 RepID=A0A811RZQ3_9POAL|nr:unnamed protein product [Miscanthus lutarioriparius]
MVDMVTSSPTALHHGILAEMKERPISIKLPKFAITFSWGDLKGDLSQLGLSLPFSPEAADLSGMCKGDDGDQVVTGAARGPTFLSKVAHTAVVKMDEAYELLQRVFLGCARAGVLDTGGRACLFLLLVVRTK